MPRIDFAVKMSTASQIGSKDAKMFTLLPNVDHAKMTGTNLVIPRIRGNVETSVVLLFVGGRDIRERLRRKPTNTIGFRVASLTVFNTRTVVTKPGRFQVLR